MIDAANRLAAYEDTGYTPREIADLEIQHRTEKCEAAGYDCCELGKYHALGDYEHLRELVQAKKEGRLVVLPCKADGNITLRHSDGHDYQADHWNIFLTACRDADTPAGYKARLFSIEEAETALERQEGELK